MPNKWTNIEKVSGHMTLDGVKSGTKVKVVRLPDGHQGNARLTNLGIGPGVDMEVLTVHPFRGPIVVKLDGNSVAIGHNLARRIVVEES